MPYGPIVPWAEYHVTPRHLAGATSTGDLALRPLLDRGWHLTHDELGNVFVAASSFTPEGLVAAMNTALTDPTPVIRYGEDLRHLPPQATATAVKPNVPTPLDVRRAQAARARSTLAPPTGATRPVIPPPRQPSAPQRPQASAPGR